MIRHGKHARQRLEGDRDVSIDDEPGMPCPMQETGRPGDLLRPL